MSKNTEIKSDKIDTKTNSDSANVNSDSEKEKHQVKFSYQFTTSQEITGKLGNLNKSHKITDELGNLIEPQEITDRLGNLNNNNLSITCLSCNFTYTWTKAMPNAMEFKKKNEKNLKLFEREHVMQRHSPDNDEKKKYLSDKSESQRVFYEWAEPVRKYMFQLIEQADQDRMTEINQLKMYNPSEFWGTLHFPQEVIEDNGQNMDFKDFKAAYDHDKSAVYCIECKQQIVSFIHYGTSETKIESETRCLKESKKECFKHFLDHHASLKERLDYQSKQKKFFEWLKEKPHPIWMKSQKRQELAMKQFKMLEQEWIKDHPSDFYIIMGLIPFN